MWRMIKEKFLELITLNTPRDELIKILTAINSRDDKTFYEHVDLKNFMDIGYDEATEVLAENCAKFHKLYPKDLFFQFGATILRFYNSKFRGVHLGLISKVIAAYFDGSFKEAKNFSETPIKFLAAELNTLLKSIRADFGEEKILGDSATLAVKMVGNDSQDDRRAEFCFGVRPARRRVATSQDKKRRRIGSADFGHCGKILASVVGFGH